MRYWAPRFAVHVIFAMWMVMFAALGAWAFWGPPNTLGIWLIGLPTGAVCWPLALWLRHDDDDLTRTEGDE